MEFIFKHESTGEIRKVFIKDELIKSECEQMARNKLVCGCQPVGETNVVECNCDDYIDGFDLVFGEA